MRLFLDTEFNGFGGSLISMALVSEFGHEWYEVVRMMEPPHPWVAEHVLPVLGKAPVSMRELRNSLWLFLAQFDGEPDIYADWYTDFMHFFGAFEGRNHAESLNYPCRAILLSDTAPTPEQPHNALSDARALRDWFRSVP